MHLKTIPALLLAGLTACGAARTPATDALEKRLPLAVASVTLENGLRVYVHEDHRVPLVAVAVAYRAGSAQDPPGKKGLAHLVEHIMFEGSEHAPRGALDDKLLEAGAAHHNAFTTFDETVYHETVPTGELETALFLESDRMGYPTPSFGALDSVRAVVLNELRQRYDSAPGGRGRMLLHAALFPEPHPYHALPIGTEKDLESIQLSDVRDFWIRNYGPDNATLVIAGDVKQGQGIALARRWFSTLPKGPPRPKVSAIAPVSLQKDVTMTLNAAVELPSIYLGWVSPPLTDPTSSDALALARRMSWAAAGRLVEKKLARNIGGHAQSLVYAGTITMQFNLEPGVKREVVLQEIDRSFENLSKWLRWSHGDDDAKEAIYDDFTQRVYELDGLNGRATAFAVCDAQFGDPRCTPKLLRGLERVSRDRMLDTLRTRVFNAHRAIVFVEPASGASLGGDLLEVH